MRVCISLRCSIGNNLWEDNLRSEPRWERLVLEACISNPEVTEIYTTGYEWPNGRLATEKYRGLIKSFSPHDCILLIQDWNASIITSHPFRAVIVNIFHGPWMEQIEEVKQTTAKLGNNIFFVIGHSVLYSEEKNPTPPLPGEAFNMRGRGNPKHSHLKNFTTMERLFYLPLPWIPQSYYEDRFFNKVLLFSQRLIFVHQLTNSTIIKWAMNKMQKNPELKLKILTGWCPGEPKDHINNVTFFLKEDINDYFWKLDELQPYLNIKDRVKIHLGIDWSDILRICSISKLYITHEKHYGGPPMEAGMFGIPFIGTGSWGALADCPDYIYTPCDKEACTILDRLMTDHDYYNKIALSYNKYAVETYSFDTFNKNMNTILRSQGII